MTLKIGIIGAGFSGISLIATIHHLASNPVEIFLFEKTGCFGAGIAYSTQLPFHLLNVHAHNMSAIATKDEDFVNWLRSNHALVKDYSNPDQNSEDQFFPRFLYGNYLKEKLNEACLSSHVKIHKISEEIEQINEIGNSLELVTANKKILIDKAVVAIGNSLPSTPAFSFSKTHYIANPWKNDDFLNIEKNDTVLLLGTGLTTVDAILTLHHQSHKGKIISISRHGLFPLPHQNNKIGFSFIEKIPTDLRSIMKFLRQASQHNNNDWQPIINAFRQKIPDTWNTLDLHEKKRFLRHGLTYWNIHRHRIPISTLNLISQLRHAQQLEVLKGNILEFNNEIVIMRPRGSTKTHSFPAKWLINCTGSSLQLHNNDNKLLTSLINQGQAVLDELKLGVRTTSLGAIINEKGQHSTSIYALGSIRKGSIWESISAPEIREQTFHLARHLLKIEKLVSTSS